MKKENRLRKNHQFQEVIQNKNQVVTKDLVVYFKENNKHSLRVGISVSKKMAKAVLRNKYRRQVRNILDTIKPWDIGKDVVIILRKPFFTLQHDKKTEVVKNIFERL